MYEAVEFRIDEYWDPERDARPGFSSYASRLEPADPRDPVGNPDVDYAPAWGRLMAELGGSGTTAGQLRPARVRFDGRLAWHFYSPLKATHPVYICGACVPAFPGATRLLFHGCSGLHVTRAPGAQAGFGSVVLDGVGLEYVGSNKSGAAHHGILVNWPSELRHFSVRNFPGNGVRVEGNAHDPVPTNASLTVVADGGVAFCGRSGVWIGGSDANDCDVARVNALYNGQLCDDEDGFGFLDVSGVGNSYRYCHTRNNRRAGYRAARFAGVRPNRSLYINCYSEHGAKPSVVGGTNCEGRSLLDSSCMVISTIDGGLADAEGSPGILTVSQGGALEARGGFSVRGANGVVTQLGSAAPSPAAWRQAWQVASDAYGASVAERLHFVHDPTARAWGLKPTSPGAAYAALGVTDTQHARPGLPVFPRGLLVGHWPSVPAGQAGGPSGPRLIGHHDPRNEPALPATFPAALAGDVVLNMLPTHGAFNFQGWVYAFEGPAPTGPARWYRFGEGYLGSPV